MSEKHHTLTLSKRDALRLYRKEILMYSNPSLPEGLPNAKEINGWTAATAVEAQRRYAGIETSPEDEFAIDMFYDRPRDIINFRNRIGGDEEV